MDQDARRKILAGGRLRKLRSELGLSQSAMANELGISVSYLNLLERNQRPVTAQLLIRLAETYSIDPRSFAHGEELRSAIELDEIFSDPLFQAAPVARSDIRALSENAPGLVDAIKRLHLAYTQVLEFQSGSASRQSETERGESLGSGPADDPIEKVRQFLQQANNHFPEIEAEADRLAEDLGSGDLFSATGARLLDRHKIRVQIMPVAVMGKTLRRFDMHRRKIMISELMEPSGRVFQTAYHLGLLEASDLFTALAGKIDSGSDQVRRLARISLANYFAAAVMMPYQRFIEAAEALAYDVEVLSARFQASFEQVAHRLTTLSRASARGVPFFMVRVDTAGNVSKRFSSGSFPFARFGGTCPLWNIHGAFGHPGRIATQVIEMPDGSRWFSLARTVRRVATLWGEPDAQFVVGLGCDMKHAHRLVYSRGLDLKSHVPTPIGINCRLCERPNCAQRAAPPLLRPLDINENVRGYSPFDTDLGR